MTADRWRAVNRIFHAAKELPASGAQAFIAAECGDDAELLAAVRGMLRHDEDTGMLDRPVVPDGSAPPVFSTGQLVSGRYRIARYLNSGGMGEVYEAEDLELNGRVALKTLLPGIARDGRMIARFKQEIQLARKVAHPNVCRVFDLARHPLDGAPEHTIFFLTMELLTGETLSSCLTRERRLSPAAALPLLTQMGEALEAAHNAGVIHRDFKASNVMLEPSDHGLRAVVTDFGIARSFAPAGDVTATVTGQLMGTFDYMAPELLSGAGATIASDVYALGMVAYKMLTGDMPYPADSPMASAMLRMRMPAPSPKAALPELATRWDAAIRAALAPDPAERCSTARDFVNALQPESDPMPLTTPLTTPLSKPLTKLRSIPRTWLAMAAGTVLLAAAGWSAWHATRQRIPAEAASMYQKGVDDLHAGAYFAATKALDQATRLAPRFSLAHARLAEAWVELDVPEKAGHEMLLARREDISGLSRRDRLQIEAIDLTITREFTQAAGKYREMRNAAGAEASDVDLDIGRADEKAGRMPQAIESYQRATRAPGQNPAAWLRLAAAYGLTADHARSEAAFTQAEKLYQLTSNLEGLTEVAYQRGLDANRRAHLDEAAADLNKALETARLAGNLHQEIRARLQLANNAFLAGDNVHAESYAREALATAGANQMESLAIRGLINLGNAYFRRRDFETAEKHYRDALALARRNNSNRLEAQSLLSLAALHDQEKRSDEAVAEAGAALAFWEPNNFVRESIQCLSVLGRFQRDRDNYPAALQMFQRMLALAEKSRDPFGKSLAHESLGGLLNARERLPEALVHLVEYLHLSTDAEHSGYAAFQCAETLWQMGRYAEAREMYLTADSKAAKFPALQLAVARSRADMAVSEGHCAEAAAACRRLLAGAPLEVEKAELTRILGLALLGSGNRREGRRLCEAALAIAEKLGDVSVLASARVAVVRARLKDSDAAGAVAMIRQVESSMVNRPLSRLTLLALAAGAASPARAQYTAEAKRQSAAISREWGASAFQLYAARQDLKESVWPLSGQFNAN